MRAEDGQIVGTSLALGSPYSFHAFIWQSGTGMVDLNTLLPPDSGWDLSSATGINDRGWIVGWGTYNGAMRAFLMTSALGPLLITHPPLDPAVGTINSYANGGHIVEFLPGPATGKLFLGWTISPTGSNLAQPAPGRVSTWANPFKFAVRSNLTIRAVVVDRLTFADVPPETNPNAEAIAQLAARGIITGYEASDCTSRGLSAPCFVPQDRLTRAQVAAMIARAMNRGGEDHGNPFADRGGLDPDLWRAVGTLAHYSMVHGYDDRHFGPHDDVTVIQAISFISRMMGSRGLWGYPPDFGSYPAMSNPYHRIELVQYAHYVGVIPGMSEASTAADWNSPVTREWFATALWAALDQYFGTDHVEWARVQPRQAPLALSVGGQLPAHLAAPGPIWSLTRRTSVQRVDPRRLISTARMHHGPGPATITGPGWFLGRRSRPHQSTAILGTETYPRASV